MYDNQKSEIKEKERIYEKLNQKLKELENERDDLNREFEAGYNEFYEYKRQLEKDINYKDVLINHLIPKKYLKKSLTYHHPMHHLFTIVFIKY